MAGGAAADANGVVSLRREVEQGVKGDHAEDLRHGQIGLGGDVAQFLGAKEFAGIVLLNGFENAEQGARPAAVTGDGFVYEGKVSHILF